MKRVITIILAMAMALSICSVAYAENGEGNKPSVTYPTDRTKTRQLFLLQQKRMAVLSRRTQAPSI